MKRTALAVVLSLGAGLVWLFSPNSAPEGPSLEDTPETPPVKRIHTRYAEETPPPPTVNLHWLELEFYLGTGRVVMEETASLLVLYGPEDNILERSAEWTVTLAKSRWKKVETKRRPGATSLTWRRSDKWVGYIAGTVGETPFIYLENLEDPTLGWFRGGPMPEPLAKLEAEARTKAEEAARIAEGTDQVPTANTPTAP